MSTPALIYLALVFVGLGVSMAKHGQPRNSKYSFGGTLIATSVVCGLLYWGGFFNQVHP